MQAHSHTPWKAIIKRNNTPRLARSSNTLSRHKNTSMGRAMAAAAAASGNGEVRVEKVDKHRYVYNGEVITRPSVYSNPRPATVTKKLPAANVAISRMNSGTTLINGVASPEDIDEYIAKKKREFLYGV